MTEVYPCLGHSSVLNWTHSASDESWFTTRWFAIESAYELAWKLGTPQTLVSDHHERKPSACGKRRQVCFSSDVELRFTMDPPLICATLVLDETRLHNWQQKPWRLHDFEILEFSDCIERAAMQVASSELFQTSGDVPNRTPLKSIENIPRSDLFKYNHERVQVQEPLSIEAALIRTSPKGAHQAPQPLTCHRSDDFYNVPSRWYGQAEHNANNENDQHEQHDEDDARFFLHEAPDSVQLLFDAFLNEGLIVGPRLDESVYLRSWHVHHIHEHRCWHPRTIELNGHWRHWFNDILEGWRDKNNPNEDTIFSIVHPNPPRSGSIHEIMFDIIISQGLEAPRNSGLITVLQKNDRAARARFSLAASLPYTTSGVQIVQGAEIIHECNRDICRIRHDGATIPFTMEPTHDVQDGDSFTIAVSSPAASSSSVTEEPCTADGMHDCPQNEEPSDHDHSDLPAPPSSSSSGTTEAARQGVHIFRLGYPQTFGRLRWDFTEHVIVDAARVVGIPSQQFACYHYLMAAPDDQTEQEESIILQHVGDIQPGSTEKLVLVDIELHASASGQNAVQAPRIMRQVHKVVPTLLRSQLLQIIRVSAYCEWRALDCLVQCNRVFWPITDYGPKRIMHGMYFRIVIPPPPDASWEIGHTLRVFQDVADLFDFPEAGRIAAEVLQNTYTATAHQEPTQQTSPAPCIETKGADLGSYDIDVPTMYAPRAYRRRLYPPHDGSVDWLIDLGQIFSDQAQAEAFEDELMLYVQTWFVNHDRHPTCRRPRPLRLERQSVTWIDDFRQLWRDLLDRRSPFSIYVIRPRPPQARTAHYACHVLIEQSPSNARAAVVLTALLEGDHRDAIIQGAFSIPRLARRQDVIDVMEIEPFCEGRSCTMHMGTIPLQTVQVTEVASGTSIRVRIAPMNAQLPVTPHAQDDHFEDIAMLQLDRSCPISTSRDFSWPEDLVTPQAPKCREFVFSASAQEFRPPTRNILTQSAFVQELFPHVSFNAFAWEEESPAARIVTWLVDHRAAAPHCSQSRTVVIYEQFADWETRIKWAWRDQIDLLADIEMHVVAPQPPQLEDSVVAHVIVIQAPNPHWVTSLVSIFDVNPAPIRYAITTLAQIYVEHILMFCNYALTCLQTGSPIRCRAWYDRIVLQPRMPLPGRSGYSIVLQIRRQPPQADHRRVESPEASVYHPTTIKLEACLPDPEVSEIQHVPLGLIDGAEKSCLPNHLVCEDPVNCAEVEAMLATMGCPRHVYLLEGTGLAFCVPVSWTSPSGTTTIVYYPWQFESRSDIIVHSAPLLPTEHMHMAFLHSLGYSRAVVIVESQVRQGLVLVQYHNNQPMLEQPAVSHKAKTPWPAPMPRLPFDAVFTETLGNVRTPKYHLTIGKSPSCLNEFFRSGKDVLCPWHDHLDLPEVVRASRLPKEHPAVDSNIEWSRFDRVIMYTDGSSKTANRRKPPLWVQEHETPDAWSFVVLGEKYGSATCPPELVFLGWHAQQVTYENDLSHYLGTDQIGSEYAEREALFWAGVWRLSMNFNVPTVFLSDSVTTTEQALGLAGCNDQHPTFHHLRGVFQTLQATMPASPCSWPHR